MVVIEADKAEVRCLPLKDIAVQDIASGLTLWVRVNPYIIYVGLTRWQYRVNPCVCVCV